MSKTRATLDTTQILVVDEFSSRSYHCAGQLTAIGELESAAARMSSASAGSVDKSWGQVGLLFPDAPHTKWYPVSRSEASRVRLDLAGSGTPDWIMAETLNNRLLAFRPSLVQRIWLLDEGCDPPENDWKWDSVLDDSDGVPLSLYRAIADWADGEPGNLDEFVQNHSEATRAIVLGAMENAGLLDQSEKVRAVLRHTTIQFTTGRTVGYEANQQNLSDLVEDLDEAEVGEVVEISSIKDDFESYYATSMLRKIEIPRIALHPLAPAMTFNLVTFMGYVNIGLELLIPRAVFLSPMDI